MSDRTERGVTLIEMLVVLVIIAITLTGVGFSFSATARSKLRASCFRFAAAVQYAYSHAVTSGMTTRLVVDFEARSFYMEETAGRVVLNREDETGEGLVQGAVGDEGQGGKGLLDRQMNNIGASGIGGGAANPAIGLGTGTGLPGLGMGLGTGAAGDMSSLMESMSSAPLTDPYLLLMSGGAAGGRAGYQRPSFSAIAGKLGAVRELDGDTQFAAAYTPHDPIPRKEGRAYIYFFPGGVTEHAIIQLSDGGERIYSVEVHPLNGRAVVQNEAIEPEGDLDALQEAEQ